MIRKPLADPLFDTLTFVIPPPTDDAGTFATAAALPAVELTIEDSSAWAGETDTAPASEETVDDTGAAVDATDTPPDDGTTIDGPPVEDVTDPANDVVTVDPAIEADFLNAEVSAVLEHALGLKAVLDDAAVDLDTQDPMYVDYVTEYQAAKAYLATLDIIL